MKPSTPNTWLNPPVSGPLSRQVRALRMTVGPRAVQLKKRSNQLTWERKGLRCKTTDTLTRMPLKVVDSYTTRSASHARTWILFWHLRCTNIITMIHAINSSTKLLSIDITKMHFDMYTFNKYQIILNSWKMV